MFSKTLEKHEEWLFKSSEHGDFPGGPVVGSSPSNAGDAGLTPGQGTRISHAAGQLGLRATTTELGHSRARAPQLERSPRTSTKDSACHNKDPACHK